VAKDQIDQVHGVQARLGLWQWLWLARDDDTSGFFDSLDPDEQSAVLHVFGERHADAMRRCCIWLTGGMLTLALPSGHQIANANSLNATATRRVTGSSTASS
jgi:hypothetical protein